jgi:hypothetical protein
MMEEKSGMVEHIFIVDFSLDILNLKNLCLCVVGKLAVLV